MAFDNVTFPYYPMKHGITKTIIDPVNVVSNGNREYRVKRQAWERYEWTLPTQTMTNEQKEEIRAFLLERGSSLNSFKFVDPDTPTLVNVAMTADDIGGFKYPQINYPQSSTTPSVAGSHPIFSSVGTPIDFLINGTPYTTPGIIFNGRPTIQVGQSNTTFFIVNHVAPYVVRLASTLSYALAALDTNNETLGTNTSAIKLIEVFGEY